MESTSTPTIDLTPAIAAIQRRIAAYAEQERQHELAAAVARARREEAQQTLADLDAAFRGEVGHADPPA